MLIRRLGIAVLAALALGAPGRAWACSATGACPNLAGCCVGNTCTIDQTVTVTGATCTLDFGLHNVILTGTLAVSPTGNTPSTVNIRALSFMITGSGLLDAHGTAANAGNNVVITTTDGAVTSFAMTGSSASRIDLTGFGTGGGSLEIHASGAVNLAGGRIDASTQDPNGTEDGGSILIDSTAGDLTVGIPLLANAGAGGGGGSITLDFPGNVTVSDAGRLSVSGGFGDAGAIELDAGGTVSVTGAGLLQANGLGGSAGFGGTIDILGGTAGTSVTDGVRILGTLEAQGGSDATGEAGGDGGAISLDAANGTLTLSGTSGPTISTDGAGGGGDGQVNLQTDAAGSDVVIAGAISSVGRGTTNNNTPGGGDVEIASAGGVTITRSIDVSGIDSGGIVNVSAARDVTVQHSILGGANLGGGSLSIDAGHDVTFTDVGAGNTVRMSGLGSGPGGDVGLTAGNDITVTGYALNASGSATFDGGTIVMQSGRHLTIANGTSLDASGGANAPARGGEIALAAGFPDIAGNLTIAGNLLAAGHDASGTRPAMIRLGGCNVLIAATGTVDSRGDTGSTNTVTGRTSITVNGKLRATGANTPAYPTGTPPTVTGANALVSPGFPSPVACPTCAKPVCTQRTPPAPTDCLMPCPQCGDGVVTAPFEDCDPGMGNPCTIGCDIHCRSLPPNCDDGRACMDHSCDAVFGCVDTPSADLTPCDDGRFCTAGDTCRRGLCVSGPLRSCDDGNPCTNDPACNVAMDTCDHTPVVCTPDPTNHCYVIPACVPATGCPTATLVHCPNPGDVCNPADGSCGPQPCNLPADCDDHNPCTDNLCVNHFCAYPAVTDGQGCDADNDVCTGIDTCHSGVCAPGQPPDCADTNVCTTDSCDPIQGCQHAAIPGCCVQPTDCPGHNLCTSCVDDTCGVIPGCCFVDADCDDGNDCTDDLCSSNQCVHNAVTDGDSCGDACNPGTCSNGTCNSTPTVCVPDNDPCTDDFCDPNAAGPDPCVHRHRDGCCQVDGDCNDQNTCTADTCDHSLCLHTEVVAECRQCTTDQDCAPDLPGSAGGACAGQRCQAGICTAVPPPNCDTAFPGFPPKCILDGAGNPSCACPADAACDDHNVCNGTETCSAAGTCVPGTPLDCNDHDLCTEDTCNAASGCAHPQKTGFDGVTCQLDTMEQALANARPTDIPPAVSHKITVLIGKVRAKLAAAHASAGKKAVKQVNGAGQQLKSIGKVVRKAMHGKKKIDPMLGSVLANAATGGGAAVEHLKATLTP